MLKWAGLALAAMLIAWPMGRAHAANTCYETAQINIDCTPKTGGDAPRPAYANPSNQQLRDLLRQRLANGGTAAKKSSQAASDSYAKAIGDAEKRAESALKAASSTNDPAQQDKAIKAYNAALADLDKAYDKAADAAATPQGRKEIEGYKADADKALEKKANEEFAKQREAQEAAAAAAEAAKPKEPDNIGMTDGYVFVCDGPLKGDHVSCREIQPDGKYCVQVMAFDGVINWRDTATTMCSPQDLAQRAAYLARHESAPEKAQNAAMNAPNCQALIKDYVDAAQAQNGPRSANAFDALNKAGGCGVLEQAEKNRHMPGSTDDPRFAPPRDNSSMTEQIFGACDRSPEACDAAIAQARAGASPEAIAAIYANAIGIGLEIGGMLGNAVLNAQAATMAHAAAANGAGNAARGVPRGTPQYPRAISCTVRGCITSDGRGPSNNNSDITGLVR